MVAGNPSVGQWHEDLWPKFRPVLEILRPDDFLGLHEYWADESDLDNRWLCGRWTIPQIAEVLGDVKIVVTECGRDQVGGRGRPGWQLTTDAGTYLWELETYDALLRRSRNVVGATVFSMDPTWGSFDVYGIWPEVVYRYSIAPDDPADTGPWRMYLPLLGTPPRPPLGWVWPILYPR